MHRALQVGGLSFRERYGPWAVVFGASEGTGAEFARQLAGRGLDVVLTARRAAALDEVAAELQGEHGVRARPVVVDLAGDHAISRLAAETTGLEVGLLVFNAGSWERLEPFLAHPPREAAALVQRNCLLPLAACAHFGPAMLARRRGGVLMLTSVSGLAGAPDLAVYAATKAFVTTFAEALWSEWRHSGVDVLALMLGITDTPTFRRVLAARAPLPDEVTIRSMTSTAAEVVAAGLEHLPDGPVHVVGDRARAIAERRGRFPRSAAVEDAIAAAAGRGPAREPDES